MSITVEEAGKIKWWKRRDFHKPACAREGFLPVGNKRVAVLTSHGNYTAVLVVPVLPNWQEIKPLLVGWVKDWDCSFHNSKGMPIHILQFIIELAWDLDLPSALKVVL